MGEMLGTQKTRDFLIVGGYDCWFARSIADARPVDSCRVALADRVNAAIDEGLLDLASEVAEVAIGVDPSVSSPWWWRGQVRHKRGQFAPAVADYSRVLELSPEYVEARFQRGYALWGGGDLGAALADFDEAVLKEHPQAQFARASVRFALDDNAGALSDIDASLSEIPSYPFSHELRAGALACLERWDEAVAAASLALQLDSGLHQARYYRAVALTKLGDLDAAVEDLEVAGTGRPDDGRIKSLLELLRAITGER
jgi:tetratricopeptide (TPR) repeat protein